MRRARQARRGSFGYYNSDATRCMGPQDDKLARAIAMFFVECVMRIRVRVSHPLRPDHLYIVLAPAIKQLEIGIHTGAGRLARYRHDEGLLTSVNAMLAAIERRAAFFALLRR